MINRKKIQRIYQEEGLAVRLRRSRKRAVGTRDPAPVPALPNQRWSLNFVHDQMASGRRFRNEVELLATRHREEQRKEQELR